MEGILLDYHLPQIRDILQKDFFYCDSVEVETQLEKEAHEDVEVLFYQSGDQLYYLLTKMVDQTSHDLLPRFRTIAISQETPIEEMINSVMENDKILVLDESKKPIGYLCSSHLLKSIYKSYQYLRTYFETMLRTTDASISIIDKNLNTMVWTKGAEEIFSIKQEEIQGTSITEHFPIDMLEIIKTLKTGKSVYKRQHQPRPDLFVLINTNPIKVNNEIVGAVAAETDITSQVRLNKELFNATTKVLHLEQEMEKLKPSTDPFHPIKGTSEVLKNTKERIEKIASTKATALILGESGVGKELFAKAVHDLSESANAPFVPINCGAIPPSLFESELFGYVKGAFSGADQRGKKGKVEMANGGTLFLDEIGELPLDMQVKLLRLLQEKKYFAVGGTELLEANCRIVAATNRDLTELMKEGKFREDLYYRLNIITINIPPLRDRKEDIIELTHSFLYEFSVRYNKMIEHIPNSVMQELMHYHWPGNVRELRNTIERLVVFSSGEKLIIDDLPFKSSDRGDEKVIMKTEKNDEDHVKREFRNISLPLQKELDLHEKHVIQKILYMERGNKLAAAKKLGISRATLYNKLNKLNIHE